MPGTYAHYAFGKEVLSHTDDEISKIISKNMDLFFIGLHGPDILFYYKPLTIVNAVNKLGRHLHHENANIFFDKARGIISNTKYKDEYFAYLFGFVCHFMLDSECHPYINRITKENHLSHTEIESEFDKLLLNREGKDPFKIDLTNHIKSDSTLGEFICPFFDLNNNKIIKSLKSMKFYSSIFNTPNKITQFLIAFSMKILFIYNKIHGVFFNPKDNPACKNICLNIESLYNNSIDKAAVALKDFYDAFLNNTPLPQRFNRDFE